MASRLLRIAVTHVASLAIILMVVLAWLPGVVASPLPAPQRVTVNVSMVDNAFQPQPVIIQVGDTVVWTNNGAVTHTSTSDTPGLWDSGIMNPGATFSRTFDTAGTFGYNCTLHRSVGMVGAVVVQPASQATATSTGSPTATGTPPTATPTVITPTPTGTPPTPTPTVTTPTPTGTPPTLTPTATPLTPTATPTPIPGQPTILVSVVDNFYIPANLSIGVGAKIVWTNNGTVQHTVTSDTGLWDSGTLSPGQTFTRTFDAPGRYGYHCNFHQGAGMVGVITVTGIALATPTPTTVTVTPSPTAVPGVSLATPTPTPGTPGAAATPVQPAAPSTPLPPGAVPTPRTLPATGDAGPFPWTLALAGLAVLAAMVFRAAARR